MSPQLQEERERLEAERFATALKDPVVQGQLRQIVEQAAVDMQGRLRQIIEQVAADIKRHAVDLSKVDLAAAPGANLRSEDSVNQPSESLWPRELPPVRVRMIDPIRAAWLYINPLVPFPHKLGGLEPESMRGLPGRPHIRRHMHIRFGRQKPPNQSSWFNL